MGESQPFVWTQIRPCPDQFRLAAPRTPPPLDLFAKTSLIFCQWWSFPFWPLRCSPNAVLKSEWSFAELSSAGGRGHPWPQCRSACCVRKTWDSGCFCRWRCTSARTSSRTIFPARKIESRASYLWKLQQTPLRSSICFEFLVLHPVFCGGLLTNLSLLSVPRLAWTEEQS